ncbi:MAG TPA: hypothetical protein VJ436_02500 [Anaerolineales bacterium]|nr:hypothetical protein [Anaerolineales bacterium]
MTGVSRNVGTTLLFANDRLRVWEMTLEPGESCELHQHAYDYVFVNLERAQAELHEPGQEPSVRGLDEGYVQFTTVGREGQGPHQLFNAGEHTLRQILVEFIGESQSRAVEIETNDRIY